MKTEYEVRFLNIDPVAFEKKLIALGAKKEGDWLQRRKTYDLKPVQRSQWIRLRTNGVLTTLAYKNVEAHKIDGTQEAEVEVSDFAHTDVILNKMGYFHKSYQENRRIRYYLDNVEIDIDFWPCIPPYVEIEGETEHAVKQLCEKLGFSFSSAETRDVSTIFEEVYHIPIDDYVIFTFQKQSKN